jgi:hypothetical protein
MGVFAQSGMNVLAPFHMKTFDGGGFGGGDIGGVGCGSGSLAWNGLGGDWNGLVATLLILSA